MALWIHSAIRFLDWFSRPGGSGLLTFNRFNDCDLDRPTRRAGLDPLNDSSRGRLLSDDDSSILMSPGSSLREANHA